MPYKEGKTLRDLIEDVILYIVDIQNIIDKQPTREL